MAVQGDEKAARLRTMPFLAVLGEEDLDGVLRLATERVYRRSQTIFTEGDSVEAVFFIVSGLVKVFTVTEDGREQLLHLLGPGEFFPHVGFLEGGRYPANAVAMEESRLSLLRRADLVQLLRGNGDLALRMMSAMIRRIAELHQRVKDLSHRDVRERVVRMLLHLAKEHGRPEPDGVHLRITLTHQDLAGMVGAARESVTRILAELRQEGLVAVDEGGLVLKDKMCDCWSISTGGRCPFTAGSRG